MSHEHSGPPPEAHPESAAHREIINNTDRTDPASTLQAFFSGASMLDAALWYAARGWPVFPVHTWRDGRCSCGDVECERVGKHPRPHHGVKDATTSEATLRLWWGAWPDANIGIACGPDSGIDVLDVDGDQGRATLADLERQHGALPTTVRAITGSGGSHFVFAHRPDAALTNSVKFADGLDTRGRGGYIVVSPSRHESGNSYRWEISCGPGEVPLQPTPDWLVKLVQERSKASKAAKSPRKAKGADASDQGASGKPALDVDLVRQGVPTGQRDEQLFRYAARLRSLGVSRMEAEVTILGLAQRCSPPFPEAEALAKVKSAFRYTVEAAKDPDAIDKAREVVADVTKRAKTDHGAPFESEARQALSLIRAVDPATWARTQQALKAAGVKLRALDDSLTDDEGDDASSGDRKSQADRLLEIGATAVLFHTPDDDAYARVEVGDHHEVLKLRSTAFKAWLTRAFFHAEERTPSAQAVTDAINMLAGRAHYDGPELPVFTRFARHGDAIYLDLSNARWEAVEITASGWRVVSDPPVRFRRSKGMLPIPEPTRGGSLSALYPLVNLPDDAARKLAVAWLVGACRPNGAFWALVLQGEHGSAKSTFSWIVRTILDPSTAPLRALPRDERDLLIAAKNSYVINFDNLSGMAPWTSDALCRLLSGGGFSTRALYSDDDETLFSAARPVFVNGIDTLTTRPDLASRALVLNLPPIPPEARRCEEDVKAEFEAAWPGILGSLLDAASAALANYSHVTLAGHPRMADVARWVVAAEPALGWPPGSFRAAYDVNQTESADTGLESDAVGLALLGLLRHASSVTGADASIPDLGQPHASVVWQGTATDLLNALESRVSDRTLRSREWPGSPGVLTNRMRRLAPVLRDHGYQVEKRKSGSERPICIWYLPPGVVLSAPPESTVPSVPSAYSRSDGDLAGTQGENVVGRGVAPGSAPLAGVPGRDAPTEGRDAAKDGVRPSATPMACAASPPRDAWDGAPPLSSGRTA